MPPLPKNGEILDGEKLRKLVEDNAEYQKYIDAQFEELDTNHNGKLSEAELKPAILRVAQLLGLPPPGTAEDADKLVDAVFQDLYSKDLAAEIDKETFATHTREVLSGIAEGLAEEPLVIAVLDGSSIKELLADKEQFNALAGELFDDFDEEKTGKIERTKLKEAIHSMGLDQIGMPEPGAKPEMDAKVDDLIAKHGHGDAPLDKEEFAQLLADIYAKLGEDLNADPIFIAHDMKVLNGGPIRKMLNDEEQLKQATDKMFDDWDTSKDGKLQKGEIAEGFKALGLAFGLPPPETKEDADKLFGAVFEAADYEHHGFVDKVEFSALIRSLFEIIVSEMEANPVVIDTTIITR